MLKNEAVILEERFGRNDDVVPSSDSELESLMEITPQEKPQGRRCVFSRTTCIAGGYGQVHIDFSDSGGSIMSNYGAAKFS